MKDLIFIHASNASCCEFGKQDPGLNWCTIANNIHPVIIDKFANSLENPSRMNEKKSRNRQGAENPEKLTGLKLGKVKKSAGGFPAVVSSIRHIAGEAGLIRGWKALKKLNQKDGFTCPGCAWPDPDDDRNRYTEYCENGAKAIAEEATAKKLDADFFSKTFSS